MYIYAHSAAMRVSPRWESDILEDLPKERLKKAEFSVLHSATSCNFWGRSCPHLCRSHTNPAKRTGEVQHLGVSFSWKTEIPSKEASAKKKTDLLSCFPRLMKRYLNFTEKLSLHGFPHKLTCLHFEAVLRVAATCAIAIRLQPHTF